MKGILALLTMSFALNTGNSLPSLSGKCEVSPAGKTGEIQISLYSKNCSQEDDCRDHNRMTKNISSFTGLTERDFQNEGSHVEGILKAEAGELHCMGQIKNSELHGEFSFTPNPAFIDKMREMGFTGLTTEKLEVYTIFGIDTSWIHGLQTAGVKGLTPDKLIPLRIFHVDPDYIRQMSAEGYSLPNAEDLIAFKVHKVSPADVRAIRAMGYTPTKSELIQMKIFKITPEYIQKMQSRGMKDLTIAKLVQIRIFKLDE